MRNDNCPNAEDPQEGQGNGKQPKATFKQVMGSPVTYALIIVVGAFQMLFSWVIYFNNDSRDVERKMNDKMLEQQERLYEKMIDMVTPAVNKVNESATKVDSAVIRVDSVAQQLKEKKGVKK